MFLRGRLHKLGKYQVSKVKSREDVGSVFI